MTLSMLSDTRAELLALARVVAEDPSSQSRAIELVPLIAADVPDALRLFGELVQATKRADQSLDALTDGAE